MKQPLRPISLAGAQLGAVRHVCALFANDEEEYRVLLPFIREGLSCGDKAVLVKLPTKCSNHSIRQSQMAWGSDSLLAVRLLKPITDGCGRQRTRGRGPPLHFQFLVSAGLTLKMDHERSFRSDSTEVENSPGYSSIIVFACFTVLNSVALQSLEMSAYVSGLHQPFDH